MLKNLFKVIFWILDFGFWILDLATGCTVLEVAMNFHRCLTWTYVLTPGSESIVHCCHENGWLYKSYAAEVKTVTLSLIEIKHLDERSSVFPVNLSPWSSICAKTLSLSEMVYLTFNKKVEIRPSLSKVHECNWKNTISKIPLQLDTSWSEGNSYPTAVDTYIYKKLFIDVHDRFKAAVHLYHFQKIMYSYFCM